MTKNKNNAKKRPVVLRYTEEEAALLFDLLHSEMEELMHMATKDRLSDEPIFNPEQREYLHVVTRFCAEQVLALAKYANTEEVEDND